MATAQRQLFLGKQRHVGPEDESSVIPQFLRVVIVMKLCKCYSRVACHIFLEQTTAVPD